ncbi:hypothetical protein ACNKHL_19050 [Shigella flexneri]
MDEESGLLGISGLSSDLHVVEKHGMKVTNARNWQLKPLLHPNCRHLAGHAASLHSPGWNYIHGGIGEN